MTRFASSPAQKKRRVLVVDDDDATRTSFVAVLRAAGFEVAEAWGAVQGIRLMLSFRPDAVVLDLGLSDGHGIEVGRAMRAIVTTARTCVVAVTGSAAAVGLVDPASFGAEEILLKPVEPAHLLAAVGRCFGTASDEDLYALPVPDPVSPSRESTA